MSRGVDARSAPERQEAEALFLANMEWVERSVASLCRRYGLGGDEADDVASWTKLRLIENDYAAIRKFRGESSIRTYLVVVVSTLFRDYRVGNWGRWRPSAAALRAGRTAVRLETLVYRDGCSLEHAARVLRTAGETDLSDRGLAALLAGLPVRTPLRPPTTGVEAIESVAAPASAEERVVAGEAARERSGVYGALLRVLDGLPAEDRLILRMQYWQGSSVADVARALHLPQKPLYRRLERILALLREQLEKEGIRPERLRHMLDELPPLESPPSWDSGEAWPSNRGVPHHEEDPVD
ncbi:MAG TPA: sigma-70 family RNA polymerase sigma factor [Longimicrobiaceae bacterium]|nr:sigma-70 family RNA polymerase sigma factor [Longimicrobiaceae bacterium]